MVISALIGHKMCSDGGAGPGEGARTGEKVDGGRWHNTACLN